MTPTLPPAQSRAVERLSGLAWGLDPARGASGAALMREHLRRAALWAERLGRTDEWPWDDLAAARAPGIAPDPAARAALERALEAAPLNRVMRDACERHLAWAALEDAGLTADDDLPPPYEPLVRLFERGGAFHTEHGWAYVGHRGVPTRVKGWEHYHRPEPITALDDAALDALDAAGAAR